MTSLETCIQSRSKNAKSCSCWNKGLKHMKGCIKYTQQNDIFFLKKKSPPCSKFRVDRQSNRVTSFRLSWNKNLPSFFFIHTQKPDRPDVLQLNSVHQPYQAF